MINAMYSLQGVTFRFATIASGTSTTSSICQGHSGLGWSFIFKQFAKIDLSKQFAMLDGISISLHVTRPLQNNKLS